MKGTRSSARRIFFITPRALPQPLLLRALHSPTGRCINAKLLHYAQRLKSGLTLHYSAECCINSSESSLAPLSAALGRNRCINSRVCISSAERCICDMRNANAAVTRFAISTSFDLGHRQNGQRQWDSKAMALAGRDVSHIVTTPHVWPESLFRRGAIPATPCAPNPVESSLRSGSTRGGVFSRRDGALSK